MSSEAIWLLGLLLGLQVKHLVADFVLQTRYMLAGKGRYGHPGGLAHAGLHGVLSAALLGLAGVPAMVAAGIVLAEVLVHYHIDWSKARWTAERALTTAQPRFWVAFGVDQLLHQVTYLLMVGAALFGIG